LKFNYLTVMRRTSVGGLGIGLNINYEGLHNVKYESGVVELPRGGWKVYLAFLIPVYYGGEFLLQVVFRYKFLWTVKHVSIGQKNYRES
jgi:hypothetical protein